MEKLIQQHAESMIRLFVELCLYWFQLVPLILLKFNNMPSFDKKSSA
jgi:lauroyl/myristoyl acyltransferase